MAQNQTTEDKLKEYRIERYLTMGFSQEQADALAESRGDDGFPLNYRKVQSAIDNGCAVETAMKIFAD